MATITYTAKRSLMAGHVEGEEYSLEIPIEDWTPQRERVTEEVTALGGKEFQTFHRKDRLWSVSTVPLDAIGQVEPDDALLVEQLQEWEDSVQAGEVFQIDPFGTAEVPAQPINVTLKGDVSDSLVNTVGYYRYSFKVRRFV
ncbi:MAG: hypothetical protein CL538_05405 [Alcanivorax sp.]|nr:hypothetical protein [Alcanivorax sp.]|tara:strand:- start:38 stop:463 length:426 start_codon:yes stop_codon:yes gene_type:complete